MVRLIVRSFLSLIFAALVGSVVIFLMMHFLGGDVVTAILGKEAGPEDVSFMRAELGLDRPLIVQYLDWLQGVLTGDLGTSYALGFDIFEQIRIRFAPTFMITFGTLLVSIPLSLVLGTYSAINVKKLRGGAVDVVTQIGLAIPAFWGGLLLVLFFAVRHRLLPIGGYVPFSEDPIASIKSVILPITALSIGVTAVFTRYVRTAMIDVMSEDFIKLAMAKGRTRRGAALHHGVRNASIPLVTVATLQLGALMAGAVVIENVFVIPGIGRLLVTSTLGREVIVVQSLHVRHHADDPHDELPDGHRLRAPRPADARRTGGPRGLLESTVIVDPPDATSSATSGRTAVAGRRAQASRSPDAAIRSHSCSGRTRRPVRGRRPGLVLLDAVRPQGDQRARSVAVRREAPASCSAPTSSVATS